MALLIANNILGPTVDLQVISLLPSSHSFRICWYNLFTQCKLIEDHHLPRISQGPGGILMITVGALKELSLGGKPTLAKGMYNFQLSQEVVLEECEASLSLQCQQSLPWVRDTRTEWKAQMGSLELRCPDSFWKRTGFLCVKFWTLCQDFQSWPTAGRKGRVKRGRGQLSTEKTTTRHPWL